jgi:hypothetical protein
MLSALYQHVSAGSLVMSLACPSPTHLSIDACRNTVAGAHLVSLKLPLLSPFANHSTSGEGWLRDQDEAALVQRFDPSDQVLDTIGFFIACFEKC